MFTNEKFIMNLLLLFILSIFIIVLLFGGFKVLSYYKSIYNTKKQNEIILLDNWVDGDSFHFETDKQLPSSLVGNEYSLTFLIYLNNLNPANKNENQILMERVNGNSFDLKIIIPKLINNPTSDLRFIFKLQSDVDVTNENKLIAPPNTNVKDNNKENNKDNNKDNTQINDLNSNEVNYTNNFDDNLFNDIENKTIRDKQKMLQNNDNDEIENNDNLPTDNLDKKKDTDYIELNNNTTHKVFHVGLVIYNNVVDIYKNGQLISSKVLAGLPEINNKQFEFFKKSNFNGSLNKVTYFNKALTHSGIKNDYMKHVNHMKKDKMINIKL